MLSKEECEIALENAVDTGIIKKDWNVLNQLIDEHFKPKENTSEFKHFKIHSQLKNCIDELNGGVSAKYEGERLMDIMGLIKNNCGVD